MKKVRLDQLVFEQGFTESRERAKTTIMSGLVFVTASGSTSPARPLPRMRKSRCAAWRCLS